MAEPEGRHRELDRHGRLVARLDAHVRVGRVRARHLEDLAAVGVDVIDNGAVDHAGQEVVPEHPLVVLDDRILRRREEHHGGGGLRQRVDDPVVEPDERQVGLSDGQVLVVAGVGDLGRAAFGDLGAVADAVEVEAVHGDVRAGERRVGARRPHLQVDLVAVELGVHRGTATVERVEVQRRRAPLHELRDGDIFAELGVGNVLGEVVVDELAEVGEPGGDLRDAGHAGVGLRRLIGGHGLCDRFVELLTCDCALRPEAREAELPQRCDRRRPIRARLALCP